MQNPRLASRYAKSLIDISSEQNVLEKVLDDMRLIEQICHQNHDLVLMLKSPIVKGDKKGAILSSILQDKVQVVTLAFIQLMISKGREAYLPEIATTFIAQYKELKKIHIAYLTTASPIGDELKQLIAAKVSAALPDGTLELNHKVDKELIGGFTLEMGDKLIDASIKYDLAAIRKQFTKNLYVADI